MPHVTHGLSHLPMYRTWETMKQRCYNPNQANYKFYGGLGIKVCERWHDFRDFYEDMGDRPEGMTLDRIDSTKDYSKENCRWASVKEQVDNRKATVYVDYKGALMTLSDASRASGISRRTIQRYLKAGKSPF